VIHDHPWRDVRSDGSGEVDTFEVPDGSGDGGNFHEVVRERSSFKCVDCGEECAIPSGFEEMECKS
jgi:hypothetical protein